MTIAAAIEPTRYYDVLGELAAGRRVSGATLMGLPGLLVKSPLPLERTYGIRDGFCIAMASAAALMNRMQPDSEQLNLAGTLRYCKLGFPVAEYPAYGNFACEIAMAADFVAGLMRCGLPAAAETSAGG